MNRWLTVALLLVTALASVAADAAEEREKLAVLDLKAETDFNPGTVKMLNEILLTAFTDARFEVLGSSDITSMISLEEQRVQLTGCADDACLAEIGGALGVNKLASASVGAVGKMLVLSVKLLDVKTARVLGRATEMCSKDETELIDAIKRGVAKVLGKEVPADPPAADKTETAVAPPPPATEAEVKPDQPMKAMDILPWATLGLTVVAAGVGGAMGGLAMSDNNAMEKKTAGNDDWQDLKDSGEKKALVADVMFGVAGAAAAATIVLFVLNALGDSEEAPAATAAVVPVRGGGVFSLGLRFE